MPMILGLTGKPGAGKDLVAKFLVDRGDWVRVAFADKIREMSLSIDPCVCSVVEWPDVPGFSPISRMNRLSEVVVAMGWGKAKAVPEVRRFLQNLGVTMRAVDEDFWVDLVDQTIVAAVSEWDKNVVVTDVRFPNEVNYLRSVAGEWAYGVHTYTHLVRVIRPGQPQLPGHDHAAEHALDHEKEDYRLMNDGDTDNLGKATMEMIADLKSWEEAQ